MEFIKKYSWAVFGGSCLLILLLTLAFGFGAAVGVSHSYNAFLNTLIPLLSMVGSWLSGIGALSAALVSLWLANSARNEDVEECEIDCRWEYGALKVNAISTGRRPVTIVSAGIHHSGMSCDFEIDAKKSEPKLPATLFYGQSVDIAIYQRDTFQKLKFYLDRHPIAAGSDVYIYVSSTIHVYEEVVPKDFLASLVSEAERYSSP